MDNLGQPGRHEVGEIELQFAFPDRVQRVRKAFDAPVEAGGAFRLPVRQAGVMPEHGVGGQFHRDAVVGASPLDEIAQDDRPGCGVIDADILSGQPFLETRIVFAEIVKKRGYESKPLKAERRREGNRQRCGFVQMVDEKLPVASVVRRSGVGEIRHCDAR